MKAQTLGFNGSKTKFNKDFDVNTSAEFGYIQPTLCEEVIPQATYVNDSNTLCQVAPLLSPLFGRMALRKFTCFVKTEDIFHHWDEVATMRKTTHGSTSNLVTNVPSVTYRWLLLQLLGLDSVYTLWHKTTNSNILAPWMSDKIVDTSSVLFPQAFRTLGAFAPLSVLTTTASNAKPDGFTKYPLNHTGTLIGIANAKVNNGWNNYGPVPPESASVVLNANSFMANYYGNMPDPDSADYVFVTSNRTETSTQTWHDTAICFRLSLNGRNFVKVMQGLGLQVDFGIFDGSSPINPEKPINILPFLAYYKAWFDLFYPTRNLNFADTNVGKLISYMDSNSLSGQLDSTALALFREAILDISRMTYVYNNDYFTGHLQSTQGSDQFNLSSQYGSISSPVTENVSVGNNGVPSRYGTTSIINRLLSAATNTQIGNILIGRSVKDYLKKYGIYTNDEDNLFISSERVNINTGVVLSHTANDDAFLGQKGGQAEARKFGGKFKFTSKKHGYLIQFMAVVPEANFSQGISPMFFRHQYGDFFLQDFDGLGFRLTPSYEFFACNNVASLKQGESVEAPPTAIGFIGRYSDYKYKTNVANGDFVRRSTAEQIGSYYLDRRLPMNDLRPSYQHEAGLEHHFYTFDIDRANYHECSPAYRFCNNDLYDFTRVFVNRDEVQMDAYFKKFFEPVDDHFIIQMVNNFSVFAPAKPISETYNADDILANTGQDKKSIELS